MAVNTGTRPGTKPDRTIANHDYICCEGPDWEKIRGNDREVQRYNAAVNSAITDLEKALIAANVAYVMLHGGHVDRGKLAQAGLRKDMTPAQVLNHIQNLAPKELTKKAINI